MQKVESVNFKKIILFVCNASCVLFVSCMTTSSDLNSKSENVIDSVTKEVLINRSLGEQQWPKEAESTAKIVESTTEGIKSKYMLTSGKVPAMRDAHPKHHGCVRAEFQVEENLPAWAAKGVFSSKKSYKAWLRFSNGSSNHEKSDAEGDARGFAIKLMGVEGRKILSQEANVKTQDFILINHPVFFSDDPHNYQKIVEASRAQSKLKALYYAGFKGAGIIFDLQAIKIANPLQTQYFSMVPYQLGQLNDAPVAVKYSAKPCSAMKDPIPQDPQPNFLRGALKQSLAQREGCFDFMVQKSTDFESMPVENPKVEWSQKDSPFVKVASIRIPSQVFDSENQMRFCENLSFTPWHSLPEHRPLGGVNRVRRQVYEATSKMRHHLNSKASRVEPVGDEVF